MLATTSADYGQSKVKKKKKKNDDDLLIFFQCQNLKSGNIAQVNAAEMLFVIGAIDSF